MALNRAFTIFFGSLLIIGMDHLPVSATPSDVLIGNWIQVSGGEKMRVNPDGRVSFYPVVGSGEIKGTLIVEPTAEGGNVAIRLESGDNCIYRVSVLKERQSINLKLLDGRSASSAMNGCVYGIFSRAENWPGDETQEQGEVAGRKGNQNAEFALSKMKVESIKIEYKSTTGAIDGSVLFKLETDNGPIKLISRFKSAKDTKEAIDQGLNTLSKSVAALPSAIETLRKEEK